MYLFGYGSLTWKFGFEPKSVSWGSVAGFERRFYQHSTDHRGTPENPGRVATMIETPHQQCFGVVLELPDDPELLRSIDYREKDGYTRHELNTEAGVNVITYIASPGNPGYLGEASTEQMAKQISRAEGPSGRNDDYLFELESVLKRHQIIDTHVFELADFVRGLT